MKFVIYIVLMFACCSSLQGQQGNLGNSRFKKKVVAPTSGVKAGFNSKIKVSKLQNSKVRKVMKLQEIPTHRASAAVLAKAPSRKTKITPLKPNTSLITFSFHGNYSRDSLTLMPRSETGLEPLLAILGKEFYDQVALFSARLEVNVRGYQDYVMKVKADIASDGWIVAEIGNQMVKTSVNKGDKEFHFVFRTTAGGYIKMQISTLVKSLQIPYEVLPLPITSIEFIEL